MPEFRTPGVYVEEVASGPRPVQASSTTETGFVGILTLPASFLRGRGSAAGLVLPGIEEQALLTWNRAVAFRSLEDGAARPEPAAESAPEPRADGSAPAAEKPATKAEGKAARAADRPEPSSGTRLSQIVRELLPGDWEVAPRSGDVVVLKSRAGQLLRLPARRTLYSVRQGARGAEWDLAFGADEQSVIEMIASHAVQAGVKHTGRLACVDDGKKSANIDIGAIQERIQRIAPVVQSAESFDRWRADIGAELFQQILLELDANVSETQAESVWDNLPGPARSAWLTWLRAHPGMQRIELAVRGFFENGGKSAYISVGVQAHGSTGPAKRKFLEDSFDGISNVAMLCAPGLDFSWQQAILEYAGPRGRGDLFAVLETPRYLLTRTPRGQSVSERRWTETDAPYECMILTAHGEPDPAELRNMGYSADDVLDRCIPRDDGGYGAAYGPWLMVENPLASGAHNRFICAPPSGHVAGMIAATDLKAGGGVHKAPANELVVGIEGIATSISDREQEALNTKGVNIIRHRPAAGIRVWGARTVASDPLWTYVNVRRMFLFLERSIRAAVQWAVFLPNEDITRRDLRGTIFAFLFQLYRRGMLDGSSPQDAFSVKCDKDNNTDADVRSGILTVDIVVRPVFPAEFIRLRFRQAAMSTDS